MTQWFFSPWSRFAVICRGGALPAIFGQTKNNKEARPDVWYTFSYTPYDELDGSPDQEKG